MADPARRHPQNVAGPWFVDTTCIDCDLVRHLAPDLFAADSNGLSYVRRAPKTPNEELAFARAMLACPTGSVAGPVSRELLERAYPWAIEGGVSMLGHASEKSFGAMSYLVERPEGNLLIEGPRWNERLAKAIAERGGLRYVLLTHRDDVADAGRYAERFGASVVIQRDDRSAAPKGVPVEAFDDEIELQRGVVAFHTPGHTRGHAMFLVDDRFLFTGDSLHGSRTTKDLGAWEDVCWYSWEEQTRSLERLAQRRFEWVLPSHGGRFHASPDEMRRRLLALVERMKDHTEPGGW